MRRALVAGLLGAACSTAAPDEQGRSCANDADCLAGQICSNNYCYENGLSPREGLAIDVQTTVPPFRIELSGNDKALERIVDRVPNRYYVDRAQVRDRLRIELLETQLEDLEEGTGEEVPVAASIELQQPSRFAREPFVVTDLSFPPPTLDGSDDDEPVLSKAWPRYDAAVDSDQPLYAKVTYQDDAAGSQPFQWGRGIVARQLMRKKMEGPGDDEFEIRTVRECHRRVLGNIRFPDGPLAIEPPPAPSPTVVVNMRHAGRPDDGDPETPVCDPNPIGETPATCSLETLVNPAYPGCATSSQCPEPYQCYADPVDDVKKCGCKRDSECPKGQVCRVDRQQCALDLTDRPAIKQVTAEALDDAAVSAWVYTYCDEDPTADRTMEFVVSAAPDARLGLPRLNYRVVLTFLVGDFMGSTPLGRICLPTWQPARSVQVPLKGKPARLFTNSAGQEWKCCDTSCLAEAATKSPPAPEKTCNVKPPITVVGTFAIPNPATWAAAACMPLSGADEQGHVRVTYGPAECKIQGNEPCSVNLSPGPAGGNGQPYVLRIEPPVGSLFRSTLLPVTIASDSTVLPTADQDLEPRVLLRGKVQQEGCTGSTCAPAEVLAERVIRGEDPSTLLGPYFYTATTIHNPATGLGEFVLPVNPGVYLVTALPTVTPQNSATGPAQILVVDLREDNPDLVEEDGLQILDLDTELLLTDGAVYTVELEDFVSNSRVIPLDLTSGEGLLDPDGEPLDLNAPGTCLAGEGCQIRRIRPVSSPLRVPQNQIVRFVARAAAAAAE